MALFTQFKQWIELTGSGWTVKNLKITAGGNNLSQGLVASQQAGKADDRSGDGVYTTIGAYFERVSGGEVSYTVAEATPANSRGVLYRTTRWRISELTLEGNLTTDEFKLISQAVDNFQHDGNGKFGLRRVVRDGEKGRLIYQYTGCALLSPIGIDDGDVGRDNEVMMMRMRIQPEALLITDEAGNKLQSFSPYDRLDDGDYFQDREKDGGRATLPTK